MRKSPVDPKVLVLHRTPLSASVDRLLTANGLHPVAIRLKPEAESLVRQIRDQDAEAIFIVGDIAYTSAMLESIRPLFSLPLIVLADRCDEECYIAFAEADDILFLDQHAHTGLRLRAIARSATQTVRGKQRNHNNSTVATKTDTHEFSVSQPKVTAFYDRLRQSIVMYTNHELRTPSMQLKSAVDKLSSAWNPTDPQSLIWLDYVTKSSNRLIDLVLEICDLAQVATLRVEPFPANEPITVAERSFVLTDRKTDWQRIHIDVVPHPVPMIYSDRNALGRVLRALLDNALKFDASGSPVALTIERYNDGVRYSVTDQGIGIRDADLPYIFESFYRSDVSNTTHSNGIGNGLAFVKSILDILNIEIEVQSELGKGSTFSFTVPLDQESFIAPLNASVESSART